MYKREKASLNREKREKQWKERLIEREREREREKERVKITRKRTYCS